MTLARLICCAALLATAFTACPVAARNVTIEVANANELAKELSARYGPKRRVAIDLLEYLGEKKLVNLDWHQRPRENLDANPSSMVTALILAASPESVTNFKATSSRIEIGPVNDFEEYVDSIDYAKVLARDERRWAIRIRIRSEEFSLEKLRERAERETSTRRRLEAVLRAIDPEHEDEEPPRFSHAPSRFKKRTEEFDEDRLGAVGVGDYALIDLGKMEVAVRVQELQRRFSDEIVRVAVHDLAEVGKLIKNRGLRRRVEQAEELAFWAPVERLRRLDGPPKQRPKEREWVDTTGRFKVMATYEGLENGRVQLRKQDGKTSAVPLSKLCERDQEYVAAIQQQSEENPFATPGRSVGRSLRADWGDVKKLRARKFRQWTFNPPTAQAVTPVEPRVTSLGIVSVSDDSFTSESLQRMWVAADGSKVIVQIETDGRKEERQHLQTLDFAAGETSDLITCPSGSWVLDVSPDAQLVLLRRGGSSDSSKTRLFVQRITPEGFQPLVDWETQPPESFHKKLSDARFLVGNRVLTHAWPRTWTIWDATSGKALYTLEAGSEKTTFVDASRRFIFFGTRRSIAIIDSANGEHVASIPHNLVLNSVVADAGMNRLALTSTDIAATIDLVSGELINALQGGLVQRGQAQFVDDFLLIDGEYLIEPNYPLLLWQYGYAAKPWKSLPPVVRAGRLWYAAKEKTAGSGDGFRIVSIPAPHEAVGRKLSQLGGIESLVLLAPGDQVTIEADTDLAEGEEKELLERLRGGLVDAGYRVVDAGGPGIKRAVVVCKRATEPIEVRIVNPDAKRPPGDTGPSERISSRFGGLSHQEWRYFRRSIKPYYTRVEIRQAGEVLWTDSQRIYPNAQFFPRKGETTGQVVARLEERDLTALETISFPGRICRRGDVTSAGAYGASVLGDDGVIKDYLEKPRE